MYTENFCFFQGKWEEIWDRGFDMKCHVSNGGNNVDVEIPEDFDAKIPIKLFAHGYNDKTWNSPKLQLVTGLNN